jgi:hypothetical protein
MITGNLDYTVKVWVVLWIYRQNFLTGTKNLSFITLQLRWNVFTKSLPQKNNILESFFVDNPAFTYGGENPQKFDSNFLHK